MLRNLQSDLAKAALHNAPGPVLEHVESARGARERRLRVYRTNVINSLTDVLAAAYPVVQRIVGDRFFRAMAQSFIESHPPLEPVLYRYGESLPEFLAAYEPGQNLPYLAAIARLEWARVTAYFAADAEPLDPQRLSEVEPHKLERVTFHVHPSLQVITASHPVFEIWQVNQPHVANVPRVDLARPESGIVFRRGHEVVQRPTPDSAATWLNAILAGEALGRATEQAAKEENFDLQDALRQALADGILTGITVHE